MAQLEEANVGVTKEQAEESVTTSNTQTTPIFRSILNETVSFVDIFDGNITFFKSLQEVKEITNEISLFGNFTRITTETIISEVGVAFGVKKDIEEIVGLVDEYRKLMSIRFSELVRLQKK